MKWIHCLLTAHWSVHVTCTKTHHRRPACHWCTSCWWHHKGWWHRRAGKYPYRLLVIAHRNLFRGCTQYQRREEWWQQTPLSESNTHGKHLWFNCPDTDTDFWAGIQWLDGNNRRPSTPYYRKILQSFSRETLLCFIEIDKTCVDTSCYMLLHNTLNCSNVYTAIHCNILQCVHTRPVAMAGVRRQRPPKFLLCTPKLSCSQKNFFQKYDENKNCAPIKLYFAPPNLNTCLRAWYIHRASIDLEPKIRTIGKNTIFLPKKNQTFFQKKILY